MAATAYIDPLAEPLDGGPAYIGPLAEPLDGGPASGRPDLRLVPGGRPGDRSAPTPLEPASRRRPVEVYRRRRFLVALVLTIAVIAASQLAGVSMFSFDVTPASDGSTPAVHVVRPGDSYAAIAASLGAAHPDVAALEISAANGNAQLTVGQRIVVDRALLGE